MSITNLNPLLSDQQSHSPGQCQYLTVALCKWTVIWPEAEFDWRSFRDHDHHKFKPSAIRSTVSFPRYSVILRALTILLPKGISCMYSGCQVSFKREIRRVAIASWDWGQHDDSPSPLHTNTTEYFGNKKVESNIKWEQASMQTNVDFPSPALPISNIMFVNLT